MGDTMRPLSIEELLARSFEEFRAKGTIFDIPQHLFWSDSGTPAAKVFSADCGTPIGPAAGPHTQLAQNILASFLSGGRYIELKTVQILDELEIEKPCIDVRDEGYNVEWSSEFTLEKAYDEYLKAWFLLHLFEFWIQGSPSSYKPSFLFNMSVGYDLEGIQSNKMDRYIDRLIDSSGEELYTAYLKSVPDTAARVAAGTPFEEAANGFADQAITPAPEICKSVTLSTMHGCPPEEIEAICRYLITEKRLDTLVKLNPTLLGYNRVREMLDNLGFGYVELNPDGFEHDLKYPDAVPMLTRLQALAAHTGSFFGVKLTNTLAAVNADDVLPGEEMYLSGRALYPLTVNLAAELAAEFDGQLPMSISGGISAWNLREVLDAGVRPVTVATDLLKPGGYGRLKDLAEIAGEVSESWTRDTVDVAGLQRAAADSLRAGYTQKDFRGEKSVSVPGPLPLLDCFVAPCIVACPIAQDVPEYVHLVGEGRYEEAFSVIYDRNPLPFMTGYLCDHACQENCTRLDWEGSVRIREAKRIAAENGYAPYRAGGSLSARKLPDRGVKAAIIGAGPAGLAAASFLAREGFEVHLFERENEPGGIIRYVIPGFRIPGGTVERDVSLIEDLGVVFHFGVKPAPRVEELTADGFAYVLAAVGAEAGRDTGLEKSIKVLGFLRQFRKDNESIDIGPVVAVVGAGDTAMDAARAAWRCAGVTKVYILYRRAFAQMPASREEYEAALADGVEFRFLTNPKGWSDNGALDCQIMELGEADNSGRPRPVPTGRFESIPVDTVITAVGEDVDASVLQSIGIGGAGKGACNGAGKDACNESGVYLIGDASEGAATIVKAIASARAAADDIISKEGGAGFEVTSTDIEQTTPLRERRDRIYTHSSDTDGGIAEEESHRCLGCRALCLKCVEVCPNRANTGIALPGYTDSLQIVHIDAFCNECGNCETFCPWEGPPHGSPYRDKVTVFNTIEDFNRSANPGFYIAATTGTVRTGEDVYEINLITGDDGKVRILESDVVPKELIAMIEAIVNDYGYLLRTVEN